MNPFHRARTEANVVRQLLTNGSEGAAVHASVLLKAIEDKIGIGIESVPSSYADLGGGSAVLLREQLFIYVSREYPAWQDEFCGLVAHELGHWYLDPVRSSKTVAHLSDLYGSDGSPASLRVEAYGARERQELQANVFARELLLPRSVAKHLALRGGTARSISANYGIPLEFVRLQLLDALLLPDSNSPSPSLKPPSTDQLLAAKSSARAANVVAGPGTGKTTTLIHRVKHLVEDLGVDPSEILVLTFTNKAATEIVERLRCAGIDHASDVWAGTFHAFGLEFLRKYHDKFSLTSNVMVGDHLKSMTMLASGLPSLDLNYFTRIYDPYDWLGQVVDGIKRLKEELILPQEYSSFVLTNPATDPELQRKRLDVAKIYAAHERMLAEDASVDFVDLLLKPALALRDMRSEFSELANKFSHILVDEYQDVTQVMVELLRGLAKSAKTLWVVGDIRQAIHHWRGASLRSLMKFDSEFKAHAGGTQIQRYALDTNRRSTEEILRFVEQVGRNHKIESVLPLDQMESEKGPCGEMPTVVTCTKRALVLESLADKVHLMASKGVGFAEQAVLCRRRDEIELAFEVLRRRGIPVLYVGDLGRHPEVKFLLCLMQILVERTPRALYGVSSVPNLRFPVADIKLLLESVTANPELQRGGFLHRDHASLSHQGATSLAGLRLLLKGRTRSSNPWDFVCDMLLETNLFLPNHGDQSIEAWVKRIALWQFAYSVRNGDGEMKQARLSRFLLRHRLRQRIGDNHADRELPPEAASLNAVKLLTVHGSKGLEFEAVHLAFASNGSFGAQAPTWRPPDSPLEIVPPEALRGNQAEHEFEEAVERNNLLYVAVSRARRHLLVYQDNEFGADSMLPQLQHYPATFKAEHFSHQPAAVPQTFRTRTFHAAASIKFSDFDTYTICPLQYWYSRVLALASEAEADLSVRARSAIMVSLQEYAKSGGDSSKALSKSWNDLRLPDQNEDPTLWRDASTSLDRGTTLINQLYAEGASYFEPTSIVGGLKIDMPWGMLTTGTYSTEFSLIRFARRRVSDLSTLLKPMVPGLVIDGTKRLTLRYVMSDKADDVPGGKRLEATKSFKAAVRYLSGDNAEVRGRHCGRCAYMTICPSAPTI